MYLESAKDLPKKMNQVKTVNAKDSILYEINMFPHNTLSEDVYGVFQKI